MYAIRSYYAAVRAVAGLLSPSTGIVDAHGLCLSLAAELEAADGTVLLHHTVEALECVARNNFV